MTTRMQLARKIHKRCVQIGGQNFILSEVARKLGVNKGKLSDGLHGTRPLSVKVQRAIGVYRDHERRGGGVRVRMSPEQARRLLRGQMDTELARRLQAQLDRLEMKHGLEESIG